jgi:hypothetical protein
VALAADLVVVGLTSRALGAGRPDPPRLVLLVQLLLVGAYLASIATRTLALGRNVIPFEVAQAAAVLLVGLGGAVAVSRAAAMGTAALGVASLAGGAACYAVAFAFVDRRQGRGWNFYFYTSLGIGFTLVGSRLLLDGVPVVLAWGLMAALTAWLGARHGRLALSVHAAAYLAAAALEARALGAAALAFAGSPAGPWAYPWPGALLVLAAGALCVAAARAPAGAPGAAAPPAGAAPAAAWVGRLPRLAVAATLVWVGGGAVVAAVLRALAAPPAAPSAGTVATVRTVVLALGSLLLAWSARHERMREWGWLVYPVLLAAALKLLLEDLRVSSAASLVVAFAVYGLALILAPRLLRDASRRSDPA